MVTRDLGSRPRASIIAFVSLLRYVHCTTSLTSLNLLYSRVIVSSHCRFSSDFSDLVCSTPFKCVTVWRLDMDRHRWSNSNGVRQILSQAIAQLDRIETTEYNSPVPARTVSPQVQSNSSDRMRLFRQLRPQYSSGPKSVRPPLKKKLHITKWRHEFVCLADKEQDLPPNPVQRAILLQAGLGSKCISFVECEDPDPFHRDLLGAFPKLIEGGG